MLARRQRPRRQLDESATIPAPIGGINTVDGSDMPALDCIYLFNMIASEHGLRSRLGYREQCTGLTGGADLEVRSTLAFTGSRANGSTDKLFGVTSTGIWDCTAEGALTAPLITFASAAEYAGYGSSHICTTPAGRFLLYCDEQNGLFVYSETTGLWSQVVVGTTQLWQASTTYVIGNKVINGGKEYVCDTDGVSAASGGPTGTGTNIADNTTRWDYVDSAPSSVIGPCLADQNAGFTADPANFAHVTVWKNRVWFTEKNTSRAYYLGVNAIYGTATSFDFGSKMRAGGHLVGLYNWTYDGGNGLDTSLVGVSGAGDVVVYGGTDPSSASTFGNKGCWFVGAVPFGRRIATEYGGDLLIMSLLGVVPISKLVLSGKTDDQSIYTTGKIANLFNQIASASRTLPGWALYIHPSDNALLVTHPSSSNNGNTDQLAMSFATRGWGRYRDLPILSACIWAGDLYFGTADGRVCRSIDYVDNVLLSDPSSYSAVKWSLLTAYRDLGSGRQKQVKLIQPVILSGASSPVIQSTAKYDFDLVEPTAPSGTPSGGWDSGLWDSALWDGDYVANSDIVGAAGMGRDVAIAIRGSATSRTVLAKVRVTFEQGGLL
jgi:hypothetical protein